MVTLPTLIPSQLPIHKNAIPSQMTGDFSYKKRNYKPQIKTHKIRLLKIDFMRFYFLKSNI